MGACTGKSIDHQCNFCLIISVISAVKIYRYHFSRVCIKWHYWEICWLSAFPCAFSSRYFTAKFTELSMNYYLLFRVRSWNNGMCCMSLYILIDLLHTCFLFYIVSASYDLRGHGARVFLYQPIPSDSGWHPISVSRWNGTIWTLPPMTTTWQMSAAWGTNAPSLTFWKQTTSMMPL